MVDDRWPHNAEKQQTSASNGIEGRKILSWNALNLIRFSLLERYLADYVINDTNT
ncbi:Uncharacterised protein [Yersinia enterocolitica]|nr:Uncharacterised protein [Yersinia enterocolitica]